MFSFTKSNNERTTKKKKTNHRHPITTLSAIERLYPPPPPLISSKRKRPFPTTTPKNPPPTPKQQKQKQQTKLHCFFSSSSSSSSTKTKDLASSQTLSKKKTRLPTTTTSTNNSSSTLATLLSKQQHTTTTTTNYDDDVFSSLINHQSKKKENNQPLQSCPNQQKQSVSAPAPALDQLLHSLDSEMCRHMPSKPKQKQQTMEESTLSQPHWKKQQVLYSSASSSSSSSSHKSSLLWQLYRREVFGNQMSHRNNIHCCSYHEQPTESYNHHHHHYHHQTVTSIPNQYRVLHHVNLTTTSTTTSTVNHIVTCCTWNPVHDDLLAVVTNLGWVYIYDVHDITLAAASSSFTKKDVLPVLEIQSMEKYIRICQWNPHQPNELFLGFEHSNEIHVYNVEEENVSACRIIYQRKNTDVKEGTGCLYLANNNQSSSSLSQQHPSQSKVYVGGTNGTLSCLLHTTTTTMTMTMTTQKKTQRTCQWTIHPFSSSNHQQQHHHHHHHHQPSEGISQLLPLQQQQYLMVGGCYGSIAIYDVQSLKRKSFSTHATPSLLTTYSLPNIISTMTQQTKEDFFFFFSSSCNSKTKNTTNPPTTHIETTLRKQPSIASIQHMSFLTNTSPYSNTYNKDALQHHQQQHRIVLPPLFIVTSCGWVWVISNLTIHNNNNNHHHATARKQSKLNNNNNITLELWQHSKRIQCSVQEKADNHNHNHHEEDETRKDSDTTTTTTTDTPQFHPYLYSMPMIATPSCPMMNDWYCVANVPSTHQITIPSSDESVHTIQTKTEDTVPSIRIANNNTKRIHDIRLPSSSSSLQSNTNNNHHHCPRSIALHPQEQWMIVSTGSKLHLLQQGGGSPE